VVHYTDAEYALLCQVPEWTRKETDLLLNLCEDYEMRFFVVHDRWMENIPQVAEKSVEELKDRFYKVQKALIRYRCGEGIESVSQQQKAAAAQDESKIDSLMVEPEDVEIPNASAFGISMDNPLFSVDYDMFLDKRRKEELKKVFERDERDVVKAMHLVLQNRDLDRKIRALNTDEKRKQQVYELFHTLISIASSMFSENDDESPAASPVKNAKWKKTKTDLFGGDVNSLSELLSGIPSDIVQKNIFRPKAKGTYLRSSFPQDLPNVSIIFSIQN
jgi:hypothetical protein